MIGTTEVILIVVVTVILFGGKKIPELARGLGRAEAEYKKAKESFKTELNLDEKKEAENISSSKDNK